MKTDNPGKQKGLGKKVADFDLHEWRKVVPEILLKGLKSTFSQNNYCKLFVQATGNKQLEEANPNDAYFGIAMGVKDSNAWDSAKWTNNLLGKSADQTFDLDETK